MYEIFFYLKRFINDVMDLNIRKIILIKVDINKIMKMK